MLLLAVVERMCAQCGMSLSHHADPECCWEDWLGLLNYQLIMLKRLGLNICIEELCSSQPDG